jgi:hypothetical protein
MSRAADHLGALVAVQTDCSPITARKLARASLDRGRMQLRWLLAPRFTLVIRTVAVPRTVVGDLRNVNKYLHKASAWRRGSSAPVEMAPRPSRPGRLPGTNSSSNCEGRACGRDADRVWGKKLRRLVNRRHLNRGPKGHVATWVARERRYGALKSTEGGQSDLTALPSAGVIFKIESSTQAKLVT